MLPVVEFEAARPQLTAMAFRILGSIHDAEDAVQTTWIKSSTAGADDLRNPAAWLTTVLTRVCLDQLRARQRRREDPLLADLLPAEAVAADEAYLQRENVSRALMVILGALTPAQRVAYVLHDLFDVPFGEVAQILDTSPDSAKKHASRARVRIGQTEHASTATGIDGGVVDAFLAAAAGGDIDQLLALMTDDCVRTADPALVPPGTPTVVTGPSAIAEETAQFVDRIRASTTLFVDGRPTRIIAPGGHSLAVIAITIRGGRVSMIDIRRASGQRLFGTA